MRTNKYVIIVALPLTILSLVAASLFYSFGIEFASNVFLGIFGSALLTLLVSIVNYLTERRKTLEAFWSYGHKAIRNLNRYSADDDLDRAIDVFLQMNEFDFQPFDDAFGDICFLINNKKQRSEIGNRIYSPIMEIRNTLVNCCWHFAEYKEAIHGNRRVMEHYVASIDRLLIKRESSIYKQEDGSEIKVQSSEPYKVDQLLSEFNTYFYAIMYPWEKGPVKDHAD